MTVGEIPTVGSSDIADILGVSSFKGGGPWRAWTRITGQARDHSDNATRRGVVFEKALRDYYGERFDVGVFAGPPYGEPAVVGAEPWQTCHPDGATLLGDRRAEARRRWRGGAREWGEFADLFDRLVEFKTLRYSFAPPYGPDGSDEVAPGYAAQCVWMMYVCGHTAPHIDRIDLAAFSTVGDEFRVFHLRRDEAVERRVVEIVSDWYEHHVVNRNPPPIDDSEACARGLSVYRRAGKEILTPTDLDLALARDLYRVRARLAELEREKSLLENKLKDRIGEAYGIDGVASFGETKRGDRVYRTFRFKYEPADKKGD